MSGTVRGLFNEAQANLQRQPADAEASAQAAAVIRHCGRALAELEFGLSLEPGYRPMAHAITQLVEPCRVAGATWPGVSGRAEALTGAAADVLAHGAPTMSVAQRWAGAVAVARMARWGADRARQFPPYVAVPQLLAVADAAIDLQQLAMLYPPSGSDRSLLDRAVPVVRPSPGAAPAQAAEDAVSALAAAVHARVARRELSMGETLACAAVLEIACGHAISVATRADSAVSADAPWRAAAEAWRAAQRACAPFDDGSKAVPPAGSPVIVWAARLERALTAAFEPPVGDEQGRPTPGTARLATGVRAVANQVPDIAADLARGTARWSGGYLLARERNLPSYEDRNFNAAVATDRVVLAGFGDLTELAVALDDARRLGMSLARELDHRTGTLGHQTHPDVAAAHAMRSTRPGDLAVLRVMAERAHRGATAVAGSPQWSFARRQPRQERGR